jgi:RHH-type proline utilization regulon transcriptional repressor/proline dehydrogenase/delta 1-pyrroline-5-carboxylate dehydrogenase
MTAAATEQRIDAVGRDLFERASGHRTRVPAHWWQEQVLRWAMRDDALRVQLFRFIDVLPALQTWPDVVEHLQDYLGGDHDEWPTPLRLVRRAGAARALPGRLLAFAVRRGVRQIAHRFIAGETLDEVTATVAQLRAQGMAFSIDVLGEATTSERDAEAYAARHVELIGTLARAARTWPALPPVDDGAAGPDPAVNISVKPSALDPHFDPIAPARAMAVAGGRLRAIFRHARERGAFVHVDMEQFAAKSLTFAIVKSLLLEDEFRDWPHVGVVLQAYQREAEGDFRDLLAWVEARGTPVTVRLVRGAYWDYEVVRAAQRGWPCPVFTAKRDTDRTFERLTRSLMEHHRVLRPAIATHNLRSITHALVTAEAFGLSPGDYEIQMLFGMNDDLKRTLVERGVRVRVYTPYGPLIPGMGYLIRRLLENTSAHSFIRQALAQHLPIGALLADPATVPPQRHDGPAAETSVSSAPRAERDDFRNEPPTDFAAAAAREAMGTAIAAVRARGGETYPLVIGGASCMTPDTLDSYDPSGPTRLVGRTACATADDAERAVAAAGSAWPAWRDTPVAERAAVLRRLADLFRRERFELAAWMVVEAGKPWAEADAEVSEAVDYCEFYARETLAMDRHPRTRHVPGEENVLRYAPRGVAAVIAPWNFPLAILTGMTTAALVTGNTVVIKPAEQTPVIAARLFALLGEAGLPPGVANFLPGRGEEVGAYLVAHPAVEIIAFTGSRAVGLEILERAAQPQPGQRAVKRVVAEMGGKNAIIVDADADLDEAVRGVVGSAFGYAGQKCSACSRAIVLAPVHDAFLARLIEAARSLPIGAAADPATIVGPLIDAEARARVLRAIEHGEGEAELVCRVTTVPAEGYFVGPVIFDRVPPHGALATEEIFGPVLAVFAARDFAEALALANDTDYALTGGVYSRRPSHIERAKREFRVGNLYVNRPITGALVDRQPFGGFKLSGIGNKAGGPDYLAQFCVPKAISENTLRHGAAPDVT